ncbi:hypothetical protein [Rodentibacter ratti]|uniref:hypothetical protein n=1 Tax=Rodentibacter ratti TaxID=1906745 RepID=UPI001179AB5B|nr:hypothetical protein [Rodentibacter ratti]
MKSPITIAKNAVEHNSLADDIHPNRAQVAALDKQIGEIKQDITKTQAKIDDTYGIGSPNRGL